MGLKICAITAGTKMYKVIINKKEKKHDKIILLANTNGIEVLIAKALIDSYISQDEFILVNNMLKEYDYMKEQVKDLKT